MPGYRPDTIYGMISPNADKARISSGYEKKHLEPADT